LQIWPIRISLWWTHSEYEHRIIKPEMLNDLLQETEELIKIFVTRIKTARKRLKYGSFYSVLIFNSILDVERSMFDVL